VISRSAISSGGRLRLDELKPPVRGLILDGDGVLWKDSEPIGDLAAVFGAISRMQLAATVATNNAMMTVDEYIARLSGFGIALEPWQIITAGEATADTLASAFPERGPVFVVGEHGLRHALRDRGFEVAVDPGLRREFVAVVAGIDQDFTYAKLQRASTLVRSGVPFYGTNPDPTFPTPHGLVPGAGAVLAAISAASGRQPIVVGKPSPLLFRSSAERMKLDAESVLVVGDRLETDIAGGQAFGARTALVLSGVSTSEQAAAWNPSPTFVASSLGYLLGA
jgi:4-nitrophenyl phosphatase